MKIKKTLVQINQFSIERLNQNSTLTNQKARTRNIRLLKMTNN